MINYLSEKGKLSSSCKYKIPDEELIKGYKVMLLNRHVDDRMITLQRQGIISFAMSSKGEECCSVASAAALELEDWIFPQYREVGTLFWRGFPVSRYLHHMFCNGEDIIAGKQMPNHFGSSELNVVTVSSPLATQIPQAAGAAYAMKLERKKNITITYFGDGTTSKGDFHSGINFAAVLKTPTIFFCRNNGYAISTPTSEQFASSSLAERGKSYGIPSFQIDGNDYFAVHETVAKAKKLCLQGKGPVFIEAMTYRVGAHSTSDDPSQYRSDKEVKEWEKRCPIKRLGLYLESKGLWDKKQQKELEKMLKKEIDNAIAAAKKTPPPALRSLVEDVYDTTPPSLEQQLREVETAIAGS